MPEGLGTTLRRQAQVVGALVRASLMTGLQYRSDFLFESASGLLRTGAVAAPLLVVFLHTDEVVGWSQAEAGLVMALFLLMNGLLGGIVEPNLGMVVEAIRTGTLDLVLLKPADAQLLVSLRSVAPARIWDVFAAAAVGALSMASLPMPGWLDVGVAALLLLAGLVSMYALWLLAICTSFFFVRVDNLRFLLWSAVGAGRWPIGVFPSWLRWVLTFAVPVGILTSFPALALLGRWDASLVLTGCATALFFLALSRWAWTRSLASYTSASS